MSRWDTWDDWPTEPESQTQPSEVEEFTKNTLNSYEPKLAEALEDVFLSDTQFYKSEENGFNNEYPLRPHAADCTFYMKTGICKFKLACKYNHPPKRTHQGAKKKEGFVEQAGNVECKYYFSPGGCKYGEACKFRHSSELNPLGLPTRLGVKSCPFFMRTGVCSYGEKCRFHHPDPTNVGVSDPKRMAQDEFRGKISESWESHSAEPDPLPVFMASQAIAEPSWESHYAEPDPSPVYVASQAIAEPDTLPAFVASQAIAEPWAPHMIMRETALYLENLSRSLPEAVMSNREQLSNEWIGYQAPTFSQEKTQKTTLHTQVNESLEKIDGPLYYHSSVQYEDFPERPGQPEYAYYMKTAPTFSQEETQKTTLNIQVNDLLEKINGPLHYHNSVQFENFPERLGQPEYAHYMKTAPTFSQQETQKTTLNAQVNDSLEKLDGPLHYHSSVQFENFPERPGQPEYAHYMKTAPTFSQQETQVNDSLEKLDGPLHYHSSVQFENFPERPRQPEYAHYMKTAPTFSQQETQKTTLNAQVNDSLEKINGPLHYHSSVQFEDFLERPGQPEYAHYMKTAPTFSQQETQKATLNAQVNDSLEKIDGPLHYHSSVQFEDFLERPGQPEYAHYMKTAPIFSQEETQKTTLNTQENDSVEKINGPLHYHNSVQFEDFPEWPGQPEYAHDMKTAPTFAQEETQKTTLNAQMNDSLEKNDDPLHYRSSVQFEDFPERPGQSECAYYMKTGYCKFKSACRYHHPINRSSNLHTGSLKDRDMNQKSFNELEKPRQNNSSSEGYKEVKTKPIGEYPENPGRPECRYFMKSGGCKLKSACRYHHPIDLNSANCSLNAKGLPMRPGRRVCNRFKQYGICKFGRRCQFDHPEDVGSLNSSRAATYNISSGSKFAALDESKSSGESKSSESESGSEA